MKKHIFGLAIFSFIVFAAAFIYGLFSFSELTPVAVQRYVPAERTHCKFRREISESENISSNVAQAVYSVKTKKLTWQGNLPNEKNATHFDLWIADGKGFDYIGSVSLKNIMNRNTVASDDLNSSLSKIAPSVNLYLIAEAENHLVGQDSDSVLKFNTQNAVPVTIDYGK